MRVPTMLVAMGLRLRRCRVSTVMHVFLRHDWLGRLYWRAVAVLVVVVISHRSICDVKTSESH
jgi:hypothetical protein